MRTPIKSHEIQPFIARLQAFADDYCRKEPSLGMIGSMAWVLGVEIDFKLVPRDTDGSPEGPDPQGLDGEAAPAWAEGTTQSKGPSS